jgi:predicted CXXCH cytochrome family protein
MEMIESLGLMQLLLLVGGVGFAALAVGSASHGRGRWLLVLGFAVPAVAAVIAYQTSQNAREASIQALRQALPGSAPVEPARRAKRDLEATARSMDALSDPLEPYVSSDRCAACHPDHYASWHATYHRSMTEPATPETVLGRFEGQILEAKGRHYRLQRRGEEYWVEMADPDWEAELIARGVRPDTVPDAAAPRAWKRIVMTTGSHHMQTYWVASARDGRLFNFPWLWLNTDQRWIPREDGFIRPPEGPRSFDLWHDSCIECHAVGGEKDFDARSGFEPRAAELGIACEACHGPGDEHIRANRDPLRRYRLHGSSDPDPTIVNPARLDAEASSQTCGYCHGINMWKPGPLHAGERFRPGDDLRDTRVVLRASAQAPETMDPIERRDWQKLQTLLARVMKQNPTVLEERFWPDGMVRVSGREHNGMIESACFASGELSCLSCHSMHDSEANDQLAPTRAGDQACLQCHGSYAEDIPAHTHHAADSVGSRCQNCHMPHTVYGLLKSIRSHWIDSPSASKTQETGRPNACNLCHLDRSLGWSADHLTAWYEQPRPALSADEEAIAEGIRWSLVGDAHQRAMIAWHMGWPEAKEAAGDAWMGYFLGHLLDDPYPAVRYLAGHSLSRLSAERALDYDFLGPPEARARIRTGTMDAWRESAEGRGELVGDHARRLIGRDGRLDVVTFERLARARDDRPMDLRE